MTAKIFYSVLWCRHSFYSSWKTLHQFWSLAAGTCSNSAMKSIGEVQYWLVGDVGRSWVKLLRPNSEENTWLCVQNCIKVGRTLSSEITPLWEFTWQELRGLSQSVRGVQILLATVWDKSKKINVYFLSYWGFKEKIREKVDIFLFIFLD